MSKLILVVDDHDDNVQILRDLLRSAGYDVVEARDGEAALAVARRRRPDLILMDIQLPLMDGYEATRRLKSDAELKGIPVIAISSHGLREEELKVWAAGCDGYIAKPFQSRQVLSTVEALLG